MDQVPSIVDHSAGLTGRDRFQKSPDFGRYLASPAITGLVLTRASRAQNLCAKRLGCHQGSGHHRSAREEKRRWTLHAEFNPRLSRLWSDYFPLQAARYLPEGNTFMFPMAYQGAGSVTSKYGSQLRK